LSLLQYKWWRQVSYYWFVFLFSIYKAYYISNQKQKKVDIFKFFKDEVNNVFDTNIFRQVKTGNFISKAHLNSWYITWLQNSCNVTWFHMWREKYEKRFQVKNMISYKDLLSFFSPLANIFCYIYNQGKDVCHFLYIPDSHYYLLFSIVFMSKLKKIRSKIYK
jgi:hypothetical protein